MKQLTEKEAEDFLEKNKFDVAKRTTVSKKSELSKVKIPFPWVMKISSKKIMHKVKVGGVILNVDSLEKAEESFSSLSKIQFFEEVIIQEMIRGKEIVIGVKNTAEFGHTIMFGKGGSDVEKNKDVSFRIFPAESKDINEMIKETAISQELTPKELEQIKNVIEKIQLLIKNNSNLEELDINPLLVNEKQAVTVDARLIFS
jgi:hypothetical protein